MENQVNWKELRVWTSYVDPILLEKLIKANILPIFIARSIGNSTLIGRWNDTAVHVPELAPSPDLLRAWKYYGLTNPEFRTEFYHELQKAPLGKVFRRIALMAELCGATGVALLGYGPRREEDHRSIVADYLNDVGILNHDITELVL